MSGYSPWNNVVVTGEPTLWARLWRLFAVMCTATPAQLEASLPAGTWDQLAKLGGAAGLAGAFLGMKTHFDAKHKPRPTHRTGCWMLIASLCAQQLINGRNWHGAACREGCRHQLGDHTVGTLSKRERQHVMLFLRLRAAYAVQGGIPVQQDLGTPGNQLDYASLSAFARSPGRPAPLLTAPLLTPMSRPDPALPPGSNLENIRDRVSADLASIGLIPGLPPNTLSLLVPGCLDTLIAAAKTGPPPAKRARLGHDVPPRSAQTLPTALTPNPPPPQHSEADETEARALAIMETIDRELASRSDYPPDHRGRPRATDAVLLYAGSPPVIRAGDWVEYFKHGRPAARNLVISRVLRIGLRQHPRQANEGRIMLDGVGMEGGVTDSMNLSTRLGPDLRDSVRPGTNRPLGEYVAIPGEFTPEAPTHRQALAAIAEVAMTRSITRRTQPCIRWPPIKWRTTSAHRQRRRDAPTSGLAPLAMMGRCVRELVIAPRRRASG
jgi:hypothetical protein